MEGRGMAQSSILGRMGQLVRANINALLDSAEDPEKMLNQMVIDYTNNIREAEEAVAQTIGNLRLLEDDAAEAREAAAEWGRKALAASRKGDEFRAAGTTAEADKFDNLAKIALKRQISFEEQTKVFDEQIANQTVLVDKLKDGLNGMRAKREELIQKKDELIARSKMARAQTKVTETLKSVNVMDPTSEVSRFEEKIRHEEAQARGMAEVASSSLESQFAGLDDVADDLEVDARLAALKGGSA
jgi:phage shock protein A